MNNKRDFRKKKFILIEIFRLNIIVGVRIVLYEFLLSNCEVYDVYYLIKVYCLWVFDNVLNVVMLLWCYYLFNN